MEFFKENKLIFISIIVILIALAVTWGIQHRNIEIKDTTPVTQNNNSDQTNNNKNNMDQVTTLQIKDDVVGTGPAVVSGDTVYVNYTGKFTDGKVFDTSIEQVAKDAGVYNAGRTYEPFSFAAGIGQVIQGWNMGIIGMKVGGKRTLTIPYDLAYGPEGYGPIPPKATLIFNIELVDIKK